MEENWKTIEEFPLYEVSDMGNVRRIGKTKNLNPKRAKGDALFVKLMRDSEPYSRTVKNLVAEAFVPRPEGRDPDLFDTPIQCVMDTDDLRAKVIQWRPRWFAIKYRRDLRPSIHPLYWDVPVFNQSTGNEHASVLTACLHDGVLMEDIYKSATSGVPVFPTLHRYDFAHRLNRGYPSVHSERVEPTIKNIYYNEGDSIFGVS